MITRFVRSFLEYEVLESTSDRAAEVVQELTVPLPLLVRARAQTRGRGRGSNSWWSDSGSLTFTLALDPAAHGLSRDREPQLALTMAVAIIEAIRATGLGAGELGIRWPNDVESPEGKLAGILPEVIETARGRRLLIGVGVNVMTRLERAPDEIRPMATSVERIGGVTLDAEDVDRMLVEIVLQFEIQLERLIGGDSGLVDDWDRLDCLRNRWVIAVQGSQTISGWGRGIDTQGGLRIDVGGRIMTIVGGQIAR